MRKTIGILAAVLSLTFLTVSNAASVWAGGNIRKIQAKVIDVKFCSPEREGVCVKTDKGDLTLMSPYSGAIDGDSFKELFHMLHVVKDSTVTLVVEGDDEIIGIKTTHFEFIAPEFDGKTLKTLTPRKMP